MNKKGLVLLSGGLDSTLAARMMLEQGIEIEAINFVTSFCTCTKRGCKNEAKKVSENLGINLEIMNVTSEYLEIVKRPKHGYGSNMNPCIDCRIFMFKKAKSYMERIEASFIVTGEVLGERPMSQRFDAIRLIEREAGLQGIVVRPLSAKLFEPSVAEREGIVDRDDLLDIQGRSRRPQMDLAKNFNIVDYPCPAGGCLLTDPGFSRRARDLLTHGIFTLENIELLKIGRHFRLNPKAKLVVGRNRDENNRLLGLAIDSDIIFDAKDTPGPIGLLRGEGIDGDCVERSASIVLRYSDNGRGGTKVIYWKAPERIKEEVIAYPATQEMLREGRI